MADKTVLFVLSSHDKLVSGKPTGWYLPEAAHPYYQVQQAGYKVEFASPKGGQAPLDPSSVEAFKEDDESTKFLNSEETKKAVANTKPLAQVNEKDYAAVMYVGGHGPVFDLTTDAESIQLIQDFWAAGKPVASVCHGPTVFLNVMDTKTGEAFVKGKKITCFSDEEEKQAGLVDEIPFLVEKELRAKGADFVLAREPWGEEVVVDGQLLTGGNPASASALGKKLVEALKQQ
ncbi:type 1 glutamine amidotransferase domain-containing protein [Rhodotorula paludigena]|uniref:type 1 glutamine amidotransferase domain-containing protein n=1 Tax=Rhodotorula paludigena TaxID=86838 RepID=UPI00317A545D